jgi:hypothetical protein
MSDSNYDDTGEIEIDPDVAFLEWRRQVTRALNRQTKIEAERTGASRTTSKLIAFFGTTITAAAIGCFVWLWNTQAASQQHSNRLAQQEREQQEQSESIEENATKIDTIDRRLTSNEATTRAVNERLGEILQELRAQRGRRGQ